MVALAAALGLEALGAVVALPGLEALGAVVAPALAGEDVPQAKAKSATSRMYGLFTGLQDEMRLEDRSGGVRPLCHWTHFFVFRSGRLTIVS